MVTDQIADLLTRIRNAQTAGHPTVAVPHSKVKELILSVLEEEGYIDGFERISTDRAKCSLKIGLRYHGDGGPVIREIVRLSKPGRRVYVGKDDIPRNRSGLGVVVVSTPKGVLSDRRARSEGVGGELVCSVF